jgi:deoxyadenosine/deoxycytidine kinase
MEKKLLEDDPKIDMTQLKVTDWDSFLKAYSLINRPIKYDKERCLAVEMPFEITLDNGVNIGGRIDLVYQEDGYLLINDFKTSNTALTDHEIKSDIQLKMYQLAITEIANMTMEEREKMIETVAEVYGPLSEINKQFILSFTQIPNIMVALDYLWLDKRVETRYSDSEMNIFKDYLSYLWSLVTLYGDDGEAFEPNPDFLCYWCGHKNKCPAYNFEANKDEIDPVKKYTDYKTKHGWLDQEIKALQPVLIASSNGKSFENDTHKFSVHQREMNPVDVELAAKALEVPEAKSTDQIVAELLKKKGYREEEIYTSRLSNPYIIMRKKRT